MTTVSTSVDAKTEDSLFMEVQEFVEEYPNVDEDLLKREGRFHVDSLVRAKLVHDACKRFKLDMDQIFYFVNQLKENQTIETICGWIRKARAQKMVHPICPK